MDSVNQTLYIPLYGKALVSRMGLFLRDEMAERIWEEVQFPLKGKAKSKWLAYNMGIRAAVFDRWTEEKLAENRDAVVLHLGCGLDSREQKQAMECLRRKNTHELKTLCCGKEGAWEKLEVIASCHGGREALEQVSKAMTTEAERRAVEELQSLWAILEVGGCGSCVRLDFSVGNNMRYYSGVVFRGYLEGIPQSILSGGQYDKLPQKMGRRARAIGFAIYLDLLQELYREESAFDVDTVILHDGTVDIRILADAAEEAAKEGTVLVARELPENRKCRRVWRFEKGERAE